jgi:thioredoxin
MRLVLGDTPGDADHYAAGDHEAASGLADQTSFLAENHRMAAATVVAQLPMKLSVQETRHFPVDHYFKVSISGCGVSQLYSLTAVTYGCSGSNSERRSVPSCWRLLAMIKKLISVLSAAVLMSAVAFGAHAAEKVNYDAKSFAAAQAAGKPILVEIHATWCPTCKAQAPILSDLEKQDKFRNLTVFHVDFDSQKDAVKAFGARMQSTLITFKGSLETGRSVGDTNPSSIAALLDKTT